MPPKPTLTNLTNRDLVSAMHVLEESHAGRSGGFFMMFDRHPSEGFAHLQELEKEQKAQARLARDEVQGVEDSAREPAARKAWASEPPQDLSTLPKPPQRLPRPAPASARPDVPAAGRSDAPLSGWAALPANLTQPPAGSAQRVPCAKCEGRGSRTMVRPGGACWLCGHQN
mmetsp:Transcript_43176/g.133610  ORF Transcript_43176/g.133610 Transcript_43176/m.133610 type:complete len:171 (-) Transcript_43176:76-588(-)